MIPSNPFHEQSFYSGLLTEVKKNTQISWQKEKKYRLGVKGLALKWETDVQPCCYILFNSILHKVVSIAGYKDIQKENLAPGLLYSRKVNIWLSKNTKKQAPNPKKLATDAKLALVLFLSHQFQTFLPVFTFGLAFFLSFSKSFASAELEPVLFTFQEK